MVVVVGVVGGREVGTVDVVGTGFEERSLVEELAGKTIEAAVGHIVAVAGIAVVVGLERAAVAVVGVAARIVTVSVDLVESLGLLDFLIRTDSEDILELVRAVEVEDHCQTVGVHHSQAAVDHCELEEDLAVAIQAAHRIEASEVVDIVRKM